VGPPLQAYLDVVGLRSLGYDVWQPSMVEMPELVVRTLRAALHPKEESSSPEKVDKLREAIPAPHRANFDALFNEARDLYRLRDERGMFSDAWALGLARRAIVAAGKRVAAKGLIESPQLLVDASHEEMQGLLRGQAVVSSEQLRERARWRETHSTEDAPPLLGDQPGGPPPVEWLPEKARRTQRAINCVLGAMFEVPKPAEGEVIKGLPVSAGIYEGTARLVAGEHDFARIEKGDVLVARSTAAYFNPILPLLGALVTDRGGQLCHAAIVAREYGIPAVVGSSEATKRIRDGARVRVDGGRGEVTLLS
jgi:pyruvate,water dikinase